MYFCFHFLLCYLFLCFFIYTLLHLYFMQHLFTFNIIIPPPFRYHFATIYHSPRFSPSFRLHFRHHFHHHSISITPSFHHHSPPFSPSSKKNAKTAPTTIQHTTRSELHNALLK